MAMSTQRIVIMVLVLNLLVGVIADTYADPRDADTGRLDARVDQIGNVSDQQTIDPQISDPTSNLQRETAPINVIGTGMRVGGLFLKGLGFVVFGHSTQNSSPIEQYLLGALRLFAVVMNLLIVMEIYLFFVNRKTS